MAKRLIRYLCANNKKGQVMIEFAIAFPVLIIVSLITLNALLFASDCARFDNIAKNSIRSHASSPSFDEESSQSEKLIVSELQESFSDKFYKLKVSSTKDNVYHTYRVELQFYPTYFSESPLHHVFNVVFSPLKHECSLTLNPYRPSILS